MSLHIEWLWLFAWNFYEISSYSHFSFYFKVCHFCFLLMSEMQKELLEGDNY